MLVQERRIGTMVQLESGINTLGIGALEAGAVLERVVLYKKGIKKPENYFGPNDSYVVAK